MMRKRWAFRWSSATTRASRPAGDRLRYADALTTADNIMTFRMVMKEVAIEQGVYATFMPKPFTSIRVGMHTHMSLFRGPQRLLRGGRGVPVVEDRPRVHCRAAAACRGDHGGVQQFVNSYKRLWGNAAASAGRAVRRPRTSAGAQQPVGAGAGADV